MFINGIGSDVLDIYTLLFYLYKKSLAKYSRKKKEKKGLKSTMTGKKKNQSGKYLEMREIQQKKEHYAAGDEK